MGAVFSKEFIDSLFDIARRVGIDVQVKDKFVKCAFLSEIGELADSVRFKWWSKDTKELSDPAQYSDRDNFFIELVDGMILATKYLKDKVGIENFTRLWMEYYQTEPLHKVEDPADIVHAFSGIIHIPQGEEEEALRELVRFHKRFTEMSHKAFKEDGLTTYDPDDRDIFNDIVIGKLLMVVLRNRGEKRYEDNKVKKIDGSISLEDNKVLVRMWKEGMLKDFDILISENGHNMEEVLEEFGNRFERVLLNLSRELF